MGGGEADPKVMVRRIARATTLSRSAETLGCDSLIAALFTADIPYALRQQFGTFFHPFWW